MESWFEIFETLKKNKLRTFLTGFSITWGIFILIVLVSFGNGLQSFATGMFSNDLANTMYIYPSSTSIPYKGTQPGRKIQFNNEDMDLLSNKIDDMDLYSSRYSPMMTQIKYKDKKGSYVIRSVHPDHVYIEANRMLEGRFVNELDIQEFRKSAVIGITVKEMLFGVNANAIGEYIGINGIPFKVVGVQTDDSEEDEKSMIYLPVSTAQKVFGGGNNINQMVVTIKNPSMEQGIRTERKIKEVLGEANNFSPDDNKAVFVRNKLKETERISSLLSSITLFTVFIGFLAIVSGSIGVMNIMVISVKERTKEIGLRRAVGASPFSVISSIIKESVLLTLFFGYMGLLLASITLSIVNAVGQGGTFDNLLVNIPIALLATGILLTVGLISGLVPAYRAVQIKPVEALNSN